MSFFGLSSSKARGLPGLPFSRGQLGFTSHGTYTFQIPYYAKSLTFQAWGAGGAAGSTKLTLDYAAPGTDTVITVRHLVYGTVVLTAHGGGGGQNQESWQYHRGHYDGAGGAGGTVSISGMGWEDSDVHYVGLDGGDASSGSPGGGGRSNIQFIVTDKFGTRTNYSTTGGRPGYNTQGTLGQLGAYPGGGGGGWDYGDGGGKFSWDTGGGGAGGYFSKVFAAGYLHPTDTITFTVGKGGLSFGDYPRADGTGDGGSGADGGVIITWL
jgi:hypothetical protein